MPLLILLTWLHNFRDKYFDRSESYRVSMVKTFKTIPQNVENPLTTREKNLKFITDIGGGWYLEKCAKGLPPLKREKLSKKAQNGDDLIKNKLFNLICGGMIGDSNYIGTCLNGLIRNQHPKELNLFQFLQKSSILIIMIEAPRFL